MRPAPQPPDQSARPQFTIRHMLLSVAYATLAVIARKMLSGVSTTWSWVAFGAILFVVLTTVSVHAGSATHIARWRTIPRIVMMLCVGGLAGFLMSRTWFVHNTLERTRGIVGALLLAGCTAACERPAPEPAVSTPAGMPTAVVDSLAAVPDSAWIDITGPTLIGFYPVVSNEQLEKDEGLAMALDDFSFHLGTAQDSLQAAGFAVHLRGGDTLWLRTGSNRTRVVRAADSSTVGYVFADTLLRRVFVYGVRGYTELVAYAHEFKRTGALKQESR